jgi:hypothetical protein
VRTLAATSVTGVVAYQAGANDAAIAVHSFFNDMMSGAGLKEGSPQLELRRLLEANRAKKRTGPIWNRAVYVMMVRAWNYYANGNHRITGQALRAQMHAVELPTVATVVRRPSVA